MGLLQRLHEADDEPWAPEVSADPEDPHFAFSAGGTPFFIVGLHPQASREARRMPLPILVFNLHEQFEALREQGGFDRMRDAIRRRDEDLQGSVNPMVSDHGESSEARQYSGRKLEEDWEAPFEPDRMPCPTPRRRPGTRPQGHAMTEQTGLQIRRRPRASPASPRRPEPDSCCGPGRCSR